MIDWIAKPPIIEETRVGIPIWGTESYCYFTYGEDDSFGDAYKRNQKTEWDCPNEIFESYPMDYDHNESDNCIFSCSLYKIECEETHIDYYLLAFDVNANGVEDVNHWVCIPYNQFNLMKFYAEYFLPFSNKNYYRG